jgi:hypothetical protein
VRVVDPPPDPNTLASLWQLTPRDAPARRNDGSTSTAATTKQKINPTTNDIRGPRASTTVPRASKVDSMPSGRHYLFSAARPPPRARRHSPRDDSEDRECERCSGFERGCECCNGYKDDCTCHQDSEMDSCDDRFADGGSFAESDDDQGNGGGDDHKAVDGSDDDHDDDDDDERDNGCRNSASRSAINNSASASASPRRVGQHGGPIALAFRRAAKAKVVVSTDDHELESCTRKLKERTHDGDGDDDDDDDDDDLPLIALGAKSSRRSSSSKRKRRKKMRLREESDRQQNDVGRLRHAPLRQRRDSSSSDRNMDESNPRAGSGDEGASRDKASDARRIGARTGDTADQQPDELTDDDEETDSLDFTHDHVTLTNINKRRSRTLPQAILHPFGTPQRRNGSSMFAAIFQRQIGMSAGRQAHLGRLAPWYTQQPVQGLGSNLHPTSTSMSVVDISQAGELRKAISASNATSSLAFDSMGVLLATGRTDVVDVYDFDEYEGRTRELMNMPVCTQANREYHLDEEANETDEAGAAAGQGRRGAGVVGGESPVLANPTAFVRPVLSLPVRGNGHTVKWQPGHLDRLTISSYLSDALVTFDLATGGPREARYWATSPHGEVRGLTSFAFVDSLQGTHGGGLVATSTCGKVLFWDARAATKPVWCKVDAASRTQCKYAFGMSLERSRARGGLSASALSSRGAKTPLWVSASM